MLSHIVKRGVAHLQAVSPESEYMVKLQQDAEMYENVVRHMEVHPQEALPVLATGIIVVLILASIRYTLGDVVASLAMIESPSTTATVEAKPPAYTDEEPLIPAELDVDVEITLINHKPITASLCATMAHLRRVGGRFAHWRGLGISILYSLLQTLLTAILGGNPLVSILASVLLSPVHMLWTHTMIAHPTTKSFFLHRMVPFKQCTPLFLPTLVAAAAQQATVLVPVAVAFLLDVPNIAEHAVRAAQHDDACTLALIGLRILAVPATAAILALFVYLPASATLTRIEAALLPADMQPIVPFDASFAAPGFSNKALFAAAWRSFERAARVRVLKVYAKMVGVQIAVALVGIVVMAAEIYFIGGARLTIFFKAVRTQLELAAIVAQQGAN